MICPPLQCLSPISSTSSSMHAVSTSSSAQAHLLPSPSAIIPTIQKTEIRPLTTSNKFAALSIEVHQSVPLPESASNSESSNICEIPQGVKQKETPKSSKTRNRNKIG
ncbi:hypothetical protein TNCV_1981981 [Trichonephila clavipes]|nr:hypothetical protein TNCV_1981981 [Trichonephila clavipes]